MDITFASPDSSETETLDALIAGDGPRDENGDPYTLPGLGLNGWTVTMISKNCQRPDLAIQARAREAQSQQSETRALQNQVNAHFIYNVLEAIKMMAEINEEYEIGRSVGFSDEKHFLKVFKGAVGLSPSEYRKSAARLKAEGKAET